VLRVTAGFVAFLDNLVLFNMEVDEETGQQVVTAAPTTVKLRRDRVGPGRR